MTGYRLDKQSSLLFNDIQKTIKSRHVSQPKGLRKAVNDDLPADGGCRSQDTKDKGHIMVSLKDIASACGVSVATVSKSLSGHKDISEGTKRQVREKAREMGYLPNISARYLKTNRSYNIGVLFEDASGSGLTHDFFAGVLQSFKKEAEQCGYDVTFLNASATGMSFEERARFRGFDGVAIACMDFQEKEVQALLKSSLKVITIDYEAKERSAVLSDNEDGMEQLVRYAVRMGHRRIAYISGEKNEVTTVRLAGFRKATEELGITVPAAYIRESTYRDLKKSGELTLQLLDLKQPPTCILYPDDIACFGGINAIRSRGLSIPQDISVAGYDGLKIAQYLSPKLTTIAQDTDEMGREAARCLIREIEKPESASAKIIRIRGRLIEGETISKIC